VTAQRATLGSVSVRRWQENDAAELAAMYDRNREEIIATEPWRTAAHFTEEGQRRRILGAARQQPPFAGWVILEDGVLAGTVGLDHVADGSATLGYWIDASRRGRGLATAATRLVLDEAFAELDLHRVVANALPDNRPSLSLLRRLGFEPVGSVVLQPGGEHLRFALRRRSRRAPRR
jgi:ribosomal-protein-alanine N-acetyltransferase